MSKKRGIARLLALALLLSVLLLPAKAAFRDVADEAWYAGYVYYVRGHGLFRGTGEMNFSPDLAMNRAMFVTVLCRMANAEEAEAPDAGFTDLREGAYYVGPVNWAAATVSSDGQALVEGTSETTFSPDAPVTREQICTLMARYAVCMEFPLPETADAAEFTDQAEISDWALAGVTACQKAGLVSGYPDGSFGPGRSATRAEVAAMLARLGGMMEAASLTVGRERPDWDEADRQEQQRLEEEERRRQEEEERRRQEEEEERRRQEEEERRRQEEEAEKARIRSDWRLILVNPWNPVPAGYVDKLELKTTIWGEQIDARAYDDFMEMINAMWAAGLNPYLNSGFRTNAFQAYLFQNQIYKYTSMGYSYADAEELASHWVARPGTSEHEVGLAVDISMYTWDSDQIHAWLKANSWKYGFIHRYPADKTAVTGINPEAWHFRYVGKEYAKMIYDSGLVLEEFLAQYQ